MLAATTRLRTFAIALGFSAAAVMGPAFAAAEEASSPAFHAVRCEGAYPQHLQGVCTNDRDAIYWSFTTVLVKTDADGRVLKRVDVANHHGDLCFRDGKLYVAVNLGEFNEPPGRADSWVFVYDADSLDELARHKCPRVVHGAGGIGVDEDRFLVVGGLPEGYRENYSYEYGLPWKFRKRHVLNSGYTLMGIQTAAFSDGYWWFGCYGTPRVLLKADASLKLVGRWELDAALGIVGLSNDQLLVAQGSHEPDGFVGELRLALPDAQHGLRWISSPGE